VAKVECSKTDGTAKVTADCTCGYKTTMVDITAADNKWCIVGTTGKGFVFSAAPGSACAKTDGSANEGAACKCGTSTVVQVAQGKVCKVTNGVGVEHAALCAKTDGTAAETAACSCGATLTPVASGKVCIEKSSVGYEVAKVECSKTDGTAKVTADCTCGYKTTMVDITANTKYCYVTATGAGYELSNAQCTNKDGQSATAADCACGTSDTAKKGQCDFCLQSANYVGQNEKILACATTDGTGKHSLLPNSCKCGNVACGTGTYCKADIHACLVACSNNDGTIVNGATACACVAAATGVATVTGAGALCSAGTTSAVQACTNDGTTGKTGTNVNPCTCGTGGPTCTTGQTCVAATKTCAGGATPSPPSPGTPAPSPTTITQKITFSGSQASYTGALKTFSEEAYGKAIGIFDTTSGTGAWVTGCSVASAASASRRTSYAVTFTATVAPAQASAAQTASGALTTAGFATAATAVKTANNAAYGSVTAPTATAVATASSTTPSVSGASTVTTSIMAMAVAVLAAFQARQ